MSGFLSMLPPMGFSGVAFRLWMGPGCLQVAELCFGPTRYPWVWQLLLQSYVSHCVLLVLSPIVILLFIAFMTSSICRSFVFIWLLSSFTVFVRFYSTCLSDAVAVARFARASAVSWSGWSWFLVGWHQIPLAWKSTCCAVLC